MSFLPPIKGITKYYHAGDFHRWWYWLWFNRAIRAAKQEFYSWEDNIHSRLQSLDIMEQYWATHCFGCRRWLCMREDKGRWKLDRPDEKQCQVLGFIVVNFSGTNHFLCTHCKYVYNQGLEDASKNII